MPTKLAYHVQGWTPGTLETVLRANAPAVKTMARDHEPIRAVLAKRPETIMILRRYFDDGEQRRLMDRGAAGGREAAKTAIDHFADILTAVPPAQAWLEGLNECGLWNDADRFNDFTIGHAEACKEWGVRPLAYSFPCGNPPGYVDGSPEDLRAYWAHYLGGLYACQAAGGGLALHEYDAPTMRRLETWLCLRYRRVLDILPDDLKTIPIAITETGIDGGVIGAPREAAGWRAYTNEDGYCAELAWYDDEILKDANVIAATIFTAGNLDVWGSFDVTGVWPVADLINRRGASAPPAPWPGTEPAPPVEPPLLAAMPPEDSPSGAELVPLIVPVAAAEGVLPVAIVALAEAESKLNHPRFRRRPGDPAEDAARWPDVSMGPFQQTVRWSDEYVALKLPAGYPGPKVIDTIGSRYYDIPHATRAASRRMAAALEKAGGNVLDALCYYNKPSGVPAQNPNRERYARAIETAEALLAELGIREGDPAMAALPTTTIGNLEITDVRGQLPHSYTGRTLGTIEDFSIHHTVTNDPGPDASVEAELAILKSIGAYHTKQFKGFCYHYATFSSGRAYATGDPQTIRYVVGGNRNITNLAIAMIGNFTDVAPHSQHLAITRRLIENLWYQLGSADYPVYGHYEIASAGTACPGATKDQWLPFLKAPFAANVPEEIVEAVDPTTILLDTLWGLSFTQDSHDHQLLQQRCVIDLKERLGIA